MSKPLNILIVEDSEVDTELVLQELLDGGFQPNYRRVDNKRDFKKALDEDEWDIIIADYVMPHFSEPEAFRMFKATNKDIPFIVISGKIGEETAVEAMKAGATDYVMKDNLQRLVPAINRELRDAKEREARRLSEQELENFIASLTHDLRTPMLAESRILELAKKGTFGTPPPQLHEVIDELIQSNQLMQHMLNNILYAHKYKQKKIQLNLQSVDFCQFLSEIAASKAIQLLFEEKDQKLLLEPVDFVPKIRIDTNEITRVIVNLLKNASDYSPRHGTIKISMRQIETYLRVEIQDYGMGIDPEIAPHLFTAYTTTSAKKFHQVGLGLGLYLSKQIVEAHGGRIGYKSNPNEGSLFYFDLPIVKQERNSMQAKPASLPHPVA